MSKSPPPSRRLKMNLVYADDRVIGRAMRWSAVAFAALAIAGNDGFADYQTETAPTTSPDHQTRRPHDSRPASSRNTSCQILRYHQAKPA